MSRSRARSRGCPRIVGAGSPGGDGLAEERLEDCVNGGAAVERRHLDQPFRVVALAEPQHRAEEVAEPTRGPPLESRGRQGPLVVRRDGLTGEVAVEHREVGRSACDLRAQATLDEDGRRMGVDLTTSRRVPEEPDEVVFVDRSWGRRPEEPRRVGRHLLHDRRRQRCEVTGPHPLTSRRTGRFEHPARRLGLAPAAQVAAGNQQGATSGGGRGQRREERTVLVVQSRRPRAELAAGDHPGCVGEEHVLPAG